MLPSTRVLSMLSLVAVMSLFVGCSQDRHTFYSYDYRQATVSVVEAQNREPLWTMDVPVGQKLVVDLDVRASNVEWTEALPGPAKTMNWWTYDLNASRVIEGSYAPGASLDKGSVDLPGKNVVLIVAYRNPNDIAVAPEPVEDLEADIPVEPEEADEMEAEAMEPAGE